MIILQSVEIFTSEERLPIYMRITKVGGGTENHLVLNKPRTKNVCINSILYAILFPFHYGCTRAFFAVVQVILIVNILAYPYLFQTGCMAMSVVIGYYCRYCVALIL